MKITTLSYIQLNEACQEMSEKVMLFTGRTPDIIVGIRTGGEYIAGMMASHLDVSSLVYTKASRPGKGMRSRLTPLLKKLPSFLNDFLRITEHLILNKSKNKNRHITLDESIDINNLLKDIPTPLILVTDDAVDSGATMHGTVSLLAKLFPNGRIVTAAVTVTTKNSIIIPDIYLYNNTLVRFPWSADY
ncbi:phosphoribosyltransferase [uncultured Muribaculum sp.]|uniref:phosphoribosyltransferase n=1 Tax=uncultured Muribaculum sp. TaxID=1918613 RepID=UPI0025FD9A22|nr:phosphoribosyltransferase family protein [uncultured Muribaculum sp.]